MTMIGYWDVSDKAARFMDIETFDRLNKAGFTKTPNRRFIKVFTDESNVEGSVNWHTDSKTEKVRTKQKGTLRKNVRVLITRNPETNYEEWRQFTNAVLHKSENWFIDFCFATGMGINIHNAFIFDEEGLSEVLNRMLSSKFNLKNTDEFHEIEL